MRILLIEDDALNADFFLAVLEHDGHTVAHETSGILGQARAQAEPFDLVLCDIDLPGQTGIAVCRTLRETGFRGKVVALSAHIESDVRAGGHEPGFDGWIEKPIAPPALRAAVRALQP